MNRALYTLAAAAMVKEALASPHLARLDQLARLRETGAHRWLDPEEVSKITGEPHHPGWSWAKAVTRGLLTGLPAGYLGAHLGASGLPLVSGTGAGTVGFMTGARQSRHNTALSLLDSARRRVLEESRRAL